MGVDVGGTFTDLVLVDDETGTVNLNKVPTTPDDPSVGTIEGALELCRDAGVEPAAVRIVGALSPLYIPASAFALHPVVGISETSPDLRPAEAEVARAIEVPLAELADPANLHLGSQWRQDRAYDVPFFEVRNERVWGATSMILAELLAVLGLGPRNPW